MFAVYAEKFSTDDPLSGLVLGERPDPEVPDGWAKVNVKAASLNHHDLWSLWFSEAALTLTFAHPAGTSGSGRSPSTRPARGSSVENFSA